jgi:hypothetical protein
LAVDQVDDPINGDARAAIKITLLAIGAYVCPGDFYHQSYVGHFRKSMPVIGVGAPDDRDVRFGFVIRGNPHRFFLKNDLLASSDTRGQRGRINGDEGDRTLNLLVANQALSQLSYVPSRNVDPLKARASRVLRAGFRPCTCTIITSFGRLF